MKEEQITDQAQSIDEEVMMKTRGMVKSLLDDGVSPSDISFSLGYVATELGLIMASEPIRVFPVVLGGVLAAVVSHQDDEAQDKEAIEGAAVSEQSMLLH